MNKEIINQMKKRIVILGAGESGAERQMLAKVVRFDVFVFRFLVHQTKYKDMLDAHGICWEEGRIPSRHPECRRDYQSRGFPTRLLS